MKTRIYLLTAFFSYCICVTGSAQITLLGSFNPSASGSLCGIAYDPDSAWVWTYECFSGTIQCYSTSGVLLNSFAIGGELANDVDVEVAPEQLIINSSTIPKGQLLFVNGETDSAEVYVQDKITGAVTDTLHSAYGVSHTVGGSYHPIRNTFFMIEDNVPGPVLGNRIAEVDPLTGDTIQSFLISNYFNVSYGDIECGEDGNLFVVSSLEDSIAEVTPLGALVQKHKLPTGVTDLSGIALDCALNEAWVSSTNGMVYHLSQFPCLSTGIEEPLSHKDAITVHPNPAGDYAYITINNPETGTAELTLYDLQGRKVKNISAEMTAANRYEWMFTVSDLPAGMYQAHITCADKQWLTKFVKN